MLEQALGCSRKLSMPLALNWDFAPKESARLALWEAPTIE
jgi:hypothetical protein